jgi:thymidylate synthase
MANETKWPKYFKDKLIIGDPKSNVGVATLWTPKEVYSDALEKNSFSVCGQLYTKRGINPLLRNVLANPRIRYLVITGNDRQGSGEALLKFFKDGIENANTAGGKAAGEIRGWKISGDDETLIDKEIPLEALELVRQKVEIIDMRNKLPEEVAKKIVTLKKKKAFGKPQTFEEPEKKEIQQFPTDSSIFKIRRPTVGEAWIDAVKTINRFGTIIPGMYGDVKKVQNLCIVVEDENPEKPKIPPYMTFTKEGYKKYIKGFFETDSGSESYTYGERIFAWDSIDQEKIMVEKLGRFEHDRGALAVLWKPHVDNFPPPKTDRAQKGQTKGWSVPCLVMLLGQCTKGKFFMTAVFRSNDIFGSWPLNALALRTLQQRIAKKIGESLGSLTTISHIAEIYEIDWSNAITMVEKNDSTARTCMFDPRSNYLVEIQEEDIVVRFIAPNGTEELAEYRKSGKELKAARDLCGLIMKDMLVSELGAAADLGRQLAKAEAAVKLGLKFEQDKPLKKAQAT